MVPGLGKVLLLQTKQNVCSYRESWKNTLKKILNKISFHRRLDRQEVTGLRSFSNAVTALAPGRSRPGFWRGPEFTKQQQPPGIVLRKATASVTTPLEFAQTRMYLVDAAATTTTPKADKYCCISLFLTLFWLSSCKYFLTVNKTGYPPKFRLDFFLE